MFQKIKSHQSNILYLCLISLLFIELFVSTISNYKPYSLLLKAAGAIILIIFLFWNIRHNIRDTRKIFDLKVLRIPFVLISLLIFYPLISLIYSNNPEFGFLKWVHFTITLIPLLLSFYFILLSLTPKNLLFTYYLILFTSIVASILTFILDPFDPTYAYSFELTRWSHVVFGRFAGVFFIILLTGLFYIKNRLLLSITFIALILITVTIYAASLRAALTGIIIAGLIYLIFFIISPRLQSWGSKLNQNRITDLSVSRKKVSSKYISKRILLFISAVTLSIFVIIFFISNEVTTSRYKSLTDIENMGFENDGGIHSRLHFYEISFEQFLDNPFTGTGFGGMKKYFPEGIYYSHNVVLEFASELGIPGLIIFLIIIFYILYYSYKLHPGFLVYFVFALWMAMFSKDIATNGMLWVGLGVVVCYKNE